MSDKSIASKVDDDTAAADREDIYDVPKLVMKLLLMTAVVNDAALPNPLLICLFFVAEEPPEAGSGGIN